MKTEQVLVDGYKATFQHIYEVNSFMPDAEKTHACLEHGIDCEEQKAELTKLRGGEK